MRHYAVAAFALAVTIAGCAQDGESTDEADAAAIRDASQAMETAILAGDPAAVTSLFTADGAMYPPNEPAVMGSAAIQAWGEGMFSAISVTEANVTVDEVRVSGDWAMSQGHFAMTVAAGETAMTDTTKYMMLWARQPDGTWRITHDLWNSIRPVMVE
jgi:uncharacterized protein (TIGR02246 family)